MACQFMEWLIAGAGPTAFQHALVGAGCLVAFDVARRWRGKRVAVDHASQTAHTISIGHDAHSDQDDQSHQGDRSKSHRRAA